MPEFSENPRPKPPDPYLGRVIDKYALVSKLGTGGMGLVYRAEQLPIKRYVAIKLLSAKLIHDQVNVKRIEREAALMANLRHPNIATFHDFGISDGQPYLVMELISGRSLGEIIAHEKRLHPERVIAIAAQVADAMAYAHKQGLVHRDLKPDNIMLDNEHTSDYAKVLDFGIAKAAEDLSLTQSGVLIGSPSYMSPEQCRGVKLDLRSDIYSLGVIIYEALTGIVPCKGATLIETLTRKTMEQAPPFPPELSEWKALERLTLACLATEPEDRPPSMTIVRDALSAMLNPGSVSMSMSALQRQSRNPNASGTNPAMPYQAGKHSPSQDTAEDVGRSTQTRSRSIPSRSRGRQTQTKKQSHLQGVPPVLDETGQVYTPRISSKNMIVIGVSIGAIYLVSIIAGGAWLLGRGSVALPTLTGNQKSTAVEETKTTETTPQSDNQSSETLTPPTNKPPATATKEPAKPVPKTALKPKHPKTVRLEQALRHPETMTRTYRYGSSNADNATRIPPVVVDRPDDSDQNSVYINRRNVRVNRRTTRVNDYQSSAEARIRQQLLESAARQQAVVQEQVNAAREASANNLRRGNDPDTFRRQYGVTPGGGAWGHDTGSKYYGNGNF